MKKIRGIWFVFGALVLFGCSNIFLDKPRNTSSQGIPEGFGTVQVSLSQGAARTVMPEADLDELYLEYWFKKGGEAAEIKTPAGDIFTLEPGSYTLAVKAFVDSGHANLAAQGETGTAFTITVGSAAGPVNITLRPVVTGAGTGSLEFSLRYPAGVTMETFALTRIAGEEAPINLTTAGTSSGSGPVTFSGTKAAIPVGYYLLRVALKDSDGASAAKTEVVHIYQNLTAKTTLAGYTFTAGDFRAYLVTNANDSGPGSLRYALEDAPPWLSTIRVMLEPGSVIELQSRLVIYRNISIEGNGVTLTWADSWTTVDGQSQLLAIAGYEVKISGVHFKNSIAEAGGGALYNQGILTLESCIFSDNRTTLSFVTPYGGAIASRNTLTIRGCTFYRNTSSHFGGAVYFDAPDKTLTLTGNLFYENTGAFGYPVVYVEDGSIAASHNVVDVDFGEGDDTKCGWAQDGDRLVTALPMSPKTFRLYGEGAKNVISTLPPHYPTSDFYGNPINDGAAAGAVQAPTASSGYYLELSRNNDLAGTVGISNEPDVDGLVSGSFTITESHNPGYTFGYWLVNGERASAPASLSKHTWIQAVFNRSVTVDLFSDGTNSANISGTLRHALTNAQNGDIINFVGVNAGATEIMLASGLGIGKSIAIQGNGVVLSRAASWPSDSNSALLSIAAIVAPEVKISGVHFKGNQTTGRLLHNQGNLTLESCILSGGYDSSTGGAIQSQDNLTIRGCTFYGNVNGVIWQVTYFSGMGKILTLTGNLFYGNETSSALILTNMGGTTVISSYNVVSGGFGWSVGDGDRTLASLGIVGVAPFDTTTFVPVEALRSAIPSAPSDFPAKDFYNATRTFPGAAGAVK